MNFQPDFSDEPVVKRRLPPLTSFIYDECMIDEPFNASLISEFSKSSPFDEQNLITSQETFTIYSPKLCCDFYHRHLSFYVKQFKNINARLIPNPVCGYVIQITHNMHPNIYQYCEFTPVLTNDLKFGFSLRSPIHFDAFGRKIEPDDVVFTDIYQLENIFKHYCEFFSKAQNYYFQLNHFYNGSLSESRKNAHYYDMSFAIRPVNSLMFSQIDEECFDMQRRLCLELPDNIITIALNVNVLNGQIKMSFEHRKIQETVIFESFDKMIENNNYDLIIDEFIEKSKA